jgi:diacylglycerol kinase family enzyme
MKIFFLLNPSRVKNRWDWREIAARQAKRFGWSPRFGEVDRNLPHSTERLLEQAFEEDCTRIAVVGGDGSLHRTINALAQKKRLKACELAVVPAGTCNDFAHFLKLRRKNFEEAFRIACAGKAQETDLGLMDRELFLNNGGFGRRPDRPSEEASTGSPYTQGVSGRPPTPGKRARPLQTLRSFRPLHLRARWDRGSIEGSFYMGLVCNAPYFSGGLHFSKNVNLRDGLLDVYLMPAMSKWKLLPVLALGRLGRPARFKRLLTLRVPYLNVETEADLWPQADGEPPSYAARRVSFAVSSEKAMIVTP